MLYNFILKRIVHTQLDIRVFTEQKSLCNKCTNVVYNSLYIIHFETSLPMPACGRMRILIDPLL